MKDLEIISYIMCAIVSCESKSEAVEATHKVRAPQTIKLCMYEVRIFWRAVGAPMGCGPEPKLTQEERTTPASRADYYRSTFLKFNNKRAHIAVISGHYIMMLYQGC